MQFVTLKQFNPGEILGQASGKILDVPDMHTIQVLHMKHLDVRGSGIEMASHSCNPNCRCMIINLSLDDKTASLANEGANVGSFMLSLIAIKTIKIGEAPTWDYETTEWELSSPFTCHCGNNVAVAYVEDASTSTELIETNGCRKYIQGFKYLNNECKWKLLPYCSPYLQSTYEMESRNLNQK